MKFDVAVVGGGIVGLATAMALGSSQHSSLIVLEAEDTLAAHQTGHNSGVIHAGLYYKPGSLKAQHCAAGRKALYSFCRKHAVPHERCGKLVVAVDATELPALEELARRGRANGLVGLRRLGPEEMREREPNVAGVAGLLVPETGIVDYVEVARGYAGVVRQAGGEIQTAARVTGICREQGGLVVETTAGAVACSFLVNCAGLQSDRVARLAGLVPDVRIVPFRGEYYEIGPERRDIVRHLVYPVPNPKFPFLGVHFTRRISGGIEAGPNAVLAFKREGYEKWSFSLRDFGETVLYPGFWRLAVRYWRVGTGEFYRSASKRAFVRALQRLVPDLNSPDLWPGGAGIRAQALDAAGNLLDDFRIAEADRMIHVLNAPSPAATASISIGQSIAELARRNFGLS
ncbi:MAG: L-2-hydroxyglutarate oxidase [Acidobacteriota bacterium]